MHPWKSAHSIDSDAEPHHVVLILRESLDACRIEYVLHRSVAQGLRK